MREQPAKAVALLFTDIEGSTRLLQRLGKGYVEVLATHFQLVRDAVARAGGMVANTMGDGVFAVFPGAPEALRAAVDAQRSLAGHPWPASGVIRVRMGVHSGEVVGGEGDYVGLDVHRAARICAAAHGGQVLLSSVASSLCASQLPPEIQLRNLGRHSLKDLDEPIQLFQVVIPGLLSEFPPPRTLHMRPHNLPSEVTDLVGREADVGAVQALLGTTRLLTLAGPGGIGKTRLALRVAGQVLPTFDDGVFFVPLAAVRDASLVASAIGRSLGLGEADGRPMTDVLVEDLAAKQLLLVLDNFEQVLAAAPDISRLLAAAPRLKVLATSRALLHMTGETVFEVQPLEVPHSGLTARLDQLASVAGVDLFVRRARAVRPGFALTESNAPAIIRIVNRLDGLPLAIELAAVRARLFPPEILADRLEQGLKALGAGPQDATAHHRTLRESVAWSYDLLDAAEQVVFRRLGIFVGGFTLDAAEAVAGSEPAEDVLAAVSSLIDKSLLRSLALHGEARLSMLETIREFALEVLEASGERPVVAARHAAYILTLAEEVEPHLTGRAEVVAVDRLAADRANLQAALRLCLDSGDTDTGLRIGGAVWRFWHASGELDEGRRWLEALLGRPGGSQAARAKGLNGLAGLAYWQADYATALASYEEALAIHRRLGDRLREADTLFSMSTTLTWSGEPDRGGRLADEALSLFQELGARPQVGMVLMAQGFARWMRGDLDGARPLWEASLAIAREVGDHVEAATKTLALASITFHQGQPERAIRDALQALEELLELKNVTFTVMALDWMAALTAQRQPEAAVQLAGAAGRLRATLGGGMRPEACGLESARTAAGRHLDSAVAERAWATGREMDLQTAIAFARKLGAAAGTERVTAPSRA